MFQTKYSLHISPKSLVTSQRFFLKSIVFPRLLSVSITRFVLLLSLALN